MKKRHMTFVVAIIVTLLFTTIIISHVTSISAQKELKPLQGVVVALDSGHGGKDMGAQSGNIKEDVINLQIAKKTKRLLEKAGAQVVMTREGDYDLASGNAANRKKEDMKKRVKILNQDRVDVFISIHLNSYPSPNVKGAQAFYQKDNEVSKAFATIVQNHFKTLTKTNMTCKSGDYYLLNNAKKIGVLVECGFLSNASDRALLVQDDYQDKIAKTLCDSIREYFRFLQ